MIRNENRNRNAIDSLEPRTLLAAVLPTAYEQYMLELVNRARMDPTGEAARQGITLNEGLSAGTISSNAKQPLAGNYFLNDAARTHANWLRANSLFQHTGSGGSTAQQRMAAAGYTFTGTAGSAENLGLTLSSSIGDLTSRIETLFKNLFVDNTIAGRGHRLNMMNDNHREMGSGVVSGPYTYNGSNWTSIIANQNFAFSSGNPFITGVAFNDSVRADNFYTPGEAMPVITIRATSVSDNTVYSTNTNDVGGYSLRVPSGIYNITATWSNKVITYESVVVGSENVKRDFKQSNFQTPPPVPTPPPESNVNAELTDGLLWISGTEKGEEILLHVSGGNLVVTMNEDFETFPLASLQAIFVEGRGGNDYIDLGDSPLGVTVVGGEGNDTILGTPVNDTLYGNDGNDVISGRSGNDTVYGGLGDDNINGNSGRNTLYGDEGADRLNGSGGVDRLFGGAGNDRLYGQSGDDFLDGGGNVDRLYGGAGNDILNGGSSNDRLYGDAGNDMLIGSRGNDGFRGGIGNDQVLDREPGELLEEVEIA